MFGYHSSQPEYYWHQGKPHWDFGNKVVHSDLYKSLNPLRQRYEAHPTDYTQAAFFFGHIPQLSWVYGNLDYSFNKYHRHIQAHDEWYPDRKAKTLGHKNGGQCNPNMKNSKFMTLQSTRIPRGCYREIQKYQACAAQQGKEACLNQKISIMEVCPDHILEALREKRKWMLRAQAIDNETYKRAMTIGDYNKGKSVSDLTIKDWTYGSAKNMRSDSTWEDDRYDPTKFPHPHRYDNVNFGEQEYTDVFGGTKGQAASKELDHYKYNFWGTTSQAEIEHQKGKKGGIKDLANEVDSLNKKSG